MSTPIDMSIVITRHPDNQTYHLKMVIHQTGAAVENTVCQTLPEMFNKIAQFESKLPQFQNAIEYQHIDWRTFKQEAQTTHK